MKTKIITFILLTLTFQIYAKLQVRETAFKHTKTGGLNLEDSHLKKENDLKLFCKCSS